VVVGVTPASLICAATDPFNDDALSGLRFATGRQIEIRVARQSDWRSAYEQIYSREPAKSVALDERRLEREIDLVSDNVGDGPGARLVASIFEAAIAAGASDIHFEPRRHDLCIRLRVDGRMVSHQIAPADLAQPCVSRIKVIVNLDLGERRLTEATNGYALTYAYDADSNLLSMTWPDGQAQAFAYDSADHAISMGSAALPTTVGEQFTYDPAGRLTGVTRPNGFTTAITLDGASRLTGLAHSFSTTSYNVAYGLTYTPAGQAASRSLSNASYLWPSALAQNQTKAADGLNRDAGRTGTALSKASNLSACPLGLNSYHRRHPHHRLCNDRRIMPPNDLFPIFQQMLKSAATRPRVFARRVGAVLRAE